MGSRLSLRGDWGKEVAPKEDPSHSAFPELSHSLNLPLEARAPAAPASVAATGDAEPGMRRGLREAGKSRVLPSELAASGVRDNQMHRKRVSLSLSHLHPGALRAGAGAGAGCGIRLPPWAGLETLDSQPSLRPTSDQALRR